MNVSAIYMMIIPILLGIGYMLIKGERSNKKIRKGLSPMFDAVKDNQTDEIFENVGIKLSMKKYLAIRKVILLFLILSLAATILTNSESEIENFVFLIVGFFVLTYPKEKIHNKRTPFKLILDLIRANYLYRKDAELISIVSQMKNLAVSHTSNPLSAVHMLINLMRFTKITKPIFAHTISLLMRNKTKEAYEYFSKAFGTELGESFATIILKLDELDPIEFLDQIELYQISVREQHKTKRLKKQENVSNMLFLLASVPIMVIVMNFIMMVMGSALVKM